MHEPYPCEAFLAARLDEDEAWAKACAEVYPTPWEVTDRGHSAAIKADEPYFRIVVSLEQSPAIEGWLSERVQHIARHDPARVLRQVKAHRVLLAEHKRRHVCEDGMTGAYWDDEAGGMVEDPCPVLRIIATIWSDHPDYDPAWKMGD